MKLFFVDRKIQIKKFYDLSVLDGLEPVESLALSIPASENYALQLAVLSEGERKIESVECTGGAEITCINTQICDKFGRKYERSVDLKSEKIQPMFFIIAAMPGMAGRGAQADIKFSTDIGAQKLHLDISYTDERVENGGFNDLWRLSRLAWLNSNKFLNSKPVSPYVPPVIDDKKIKILGRNIEIGENGLPKQVEYFFDESVQLSETVCRRLLYAPVSFEAAGESFACSPPELTQDNGTVYITCKWSSENLDVSVRGELHYEGSIAYSVKLTAKRNVSFDDISLNMQINSECAEYINGLGFIGDKAHDIEFSWNPERHWDCLYIGNVNGGVRVKWKAENYRRPLVNMYYRYLPINIPESTWDNAGKGGIDFSVCDGFSALKASTSAFLMREGESRSFDFEMHFTPFKPIDFKKHYSVRYALFDNGKNEIRESDRAAELGMTHGIVGSGSIINPVINYPFVEPQRLASLCEYARQKQMGIKIYYTLREHSFYMAEVFAYKALGSEIILRRKGVGKGHSKRLYEYFGERIIPAWRERYGDSKYKVESDISFIVRPDSRLDNYYIEGLDWLIKNMGIKGIYVDDAAFDRTTAERAKKALMQNGGLMDLGMWNHENPRGGRISSANLYTELFPFFDSLLAGDGYPLDDISPEYLLTEISGIPYGQTAQTVCANEYMAMLCGMTNRYGQGACTAQNMYAVWDDFGIEQSEMRGWWHSKNPVKTNNDSVKATVYVKEDAALICMFNFSQHTAVVHPELNTELLGFEPTEGERIFIKSLQFKKKMSDGSGIILRGRDGIIIQIKK